MLLSDSGSALVIDYGYDFTTLPPSGTDRSSRRPWLASLPILKREYGIDRVEVAIPTHYHDDHVAGFNLLRDVEGTEIWAAEIMTPMLGGVHPRLPAPNPHLASTISMRTDAGRSTVVESHWDSY